MKRDIIIKVILGAVILACLVMYLIPTKPTKDELKFKEEYESINSIVNEKTGKKNRKVTIPEKNGVKYIDGKQLIKKIKKKDSFIVYFGFKDCPWCRSVVEILIKTMKENNVKEIYYMDIKEVRDVYKIEDEKLVKEKEGTPEYMELLKRLGKVLDDYTVEDASTGEKRIYAPNVVGIKDGKATVMQTGVSKKETNPYMKLTKTMKDDTKKQFERVIEGVY